MNKNGIKRIRKITSLSETSPPYASGKSFNYNKKKLKDPNHKKTHEDDSDFNKKLVQDYNSLVNEYNRLLVETNTLRKRQNSLESSLKSVSDDHNKLSRHVYHLNQALNELINHYEKSGGNKSNNRPKKK